MKHSEIFLSKSVSFAIEMVRACLSHDRMDTRLKGFWRQVNVTITDLMGNEKYGHRRASLFEIVIGLDTHLEAECSIEFVDGEWRSGDVEIRLLDGAHRYNENTRRWKFRCELNHEGKIDVKPAT